MKKTTQIIAACLAVALLSGCVFDSVGLGGTYTNEQGVTYGATANFHLKDKQVAKPAKSSPFTLAHWR